MVCLPLTPSAVRTKACRESAAGPRTDAVSDEKLCSRCQARPRLAGQRWCRACLTAYNRQRREERRASVTQVPVVTAPVTPPGLLVCGKEAPPGFPVGCDKPFLPRVTWRPFYCCNACGSRRAKHASDCPAVQESVASGNPVTQRDER